MSNARMIRAGGACLMMILAATAVLEAQRTKPGAPGRVSAPAQGVTGQAATSEKAGPQVADAATLRYSGLVTCCELERVESSLRGGSFLVVKNTKTGERHRVRLSRGSGKLGSAATSSKYRPGQVVAMNLDKTAFAITPFPVIEDKSNRINGNSSWKMWTDVTVSKDGSLNGKTRTKSSEAMRGFTGGVEVLLTDRAGNILHQTQLRKYGVNGTAMGGKSDRTVNWKEAVPPEALNKVSAVVIHHSYEPKVRLAAGIGWIKDNWKLVHKVYKCGKELYELAAGDSTEPNAPSPPPPAPGQPTTQPPASDSSTLECLESASDLAEKLGY